MKRWASIFVAALLCLSATDGIIVAVCDKYMEDFYPALAWLRLVQKCTLPIEVWHAGDELSLQAKQDLLRFGNLTFCDIAKQREKDPQEFRGYQIKPYILQETKFDRVILMDADIYLFLDPADLFELSQFRETGAFFFRDTDNKRYVSPNSRHPRMYPYHVYESRKKLLQEYIQHPSPYLPKEWLYFWTGPDPTDEHPQPAEFMESGLVVIDKQRHVRGIQEIVKINEDWRRVYQILLGDKDTFWIGLEIAKEPYSVNQKIPYRLYGGRKFARETNKKIDLVHHVNGRLVFQQKSPIEIGKSPYYTYRWHANSDEKLSAEDLESFCTLRYFFKLFSYPKSHV